MVAKVRWLMLIYGVTTMVAIADRILSALHGSSTGVSCASGEYSIGRV